MKEGGETRDDDCDAAANADPAGIANSWRSSSRDDIGWRTDAVAERGQNHQLGAAAKVSTLVEEDEEED